MSDSWRQILPWSSAEKADAASHASHCLQHVCVPARQCTCSPRSWNSSTSSGNTGFYLYRSVSSKQSGPKPGWLSNLETDAVTCVQDTSRRHQRLKAAFHSHMGKHYWRSCWSMEKAVMCIRTSLWTSAKLKPALFRANNSLPRKTRYVSRHFRSSCLKANKVSKSDGTWKVEYAYHFRKCVNATYQKIINISLGLSQLQFAKLGTFFWDTVYMHWYLDAANFWWLFMRKNSVVKYWSSM